MSSTSHRPPGRPSVRSDGESSPRSVGPLAQPPFRHLRQVPPPIAEQDVPSVTSSNFAHERLAPDNFSCNFQDLVSSLTQVSRFVASVATAHEQEVANLQCEIRLLKSTLKPAIVLHTSPEGQATSCHENANNGVREGPPRVLLQDSLEKGDGPPKQTAEDGMVVPPEHTARKREAGRLGPGRPSDALSLAKSAVKRAAFPIVMPPQLENFEKPCEPPVLEGAEERWELFFLALVERERRKSKTESFSEEVEDDELVLLANCLDRLVYQSGSRTVVEQKRCEPNRFVTHPSDMRRVLWDCVGILVIFYDCVMFPLGVFDLPANRVVDFVQVVIAAFWSADFPSRFCVAYYREGILESRFEKTAKRYLFSFALLDALVLILDWITIVLRARASVSDNSRFGKSARLIRLLRVFRLVNNFRKLFKEISDLVNSDTIMGLVWVVGLVFAIAFVNHNIACVWYAVGSIHTDDETWVQYYGMEHRNILYRYTSSLHWSLCQFTPASLEIHPKNEIERSFAVCILLFGMVGFSTFVSSITEWMTHVRKLDAEELYQDHMLKCFLGEKGISVDLSVRVWSFIQANRRQRRKYVCEDDAHLLKLLPRGLKLALRTELYVPIITRHPLFRRLVYTSPVTICRICREALSYLSMPPGHELFLQGDVATKMSFILSGELEYSVISADSILSKKTSESRESCSTDLKKPNTFLQPSIRLIKGHWVSEAALWMEWTHVGWLVAITHSELCELLASKFHDIIRRAGHRDMFVLCLNRYNHLFMQHLEDVGHSKQCSGGDIRSGGFNGGISDVFSDSAVLAELARRACPESSHVSKRNQESLKTFANANLGLSRVTSFLGRRISH